jgi:hypothetical protein
MALSNAALGQALAKYDAFVSNVRMSDYGYWVVTYSVAPGVTLSLMMCDNGYTQSEAVAAAGTVLTAQTGQKVMP